MDDRLSRQFFLDPQTPQQRRYEALRAAVMERQPLTEVAQRFGFAYGTLRNLVAQFHEHCRTGQVPPFSPRRHADDHRAPIRPRTQRDLQRPTTLIAVSCLSVANVPCARAWPASSCFGPCSRGSASIISSSKLTIRART